MEIKFFDSRVEKSIRSLEKSVVAKVLRTIDLLAAFGNKLSLPHSKYVESRLLELRVRGKIDVRILYTFHKGQAVLLHAFVKKGSKIPKKELYTACEKMQALDAG